MELTVIPLGRGHSISADLVPLIKIIDSSGLDYQVTAFGTMVEGSLDQLIELAKRCHLEARKEGDRVYTMMRLDDFGERTGELKGAVERVEMKSGGQVKK